jgi:ferredoxin--NADP+ reductase
MSDQTGTRPLRVAVVGAGPSGLYAVEALTKQADAPVSVDVLDRLPVPFGLVRYGVAPDHLSLRGVRDTLEKVFAAPGVRFVGGVELGTDVTLDDLRRHYDAVLLTYGASSDRHLDIPGEDLPGSVAATDLVNWYCGHPDASRDAIEAALQGVTTAVVVGVGNVAVDVTRVLAKTEAELEHTDMPQHVLDLLDKSGISDVHVLGRRGPAYASWTTKELRELGALEDADVVVDPAEVDVPAPTDRHQAKNLEVLQEFSRRTPTGRSRRIHLHFCTRPIALHGTDRVESVLLERTEMDESGAAHGTGRTWELPAQLVVRSVGYRGLGLSGLPFDDRRHVVPSSEGRVLDGSRAVPGLYVAGWIKRGPTGIIGTNKKDAAESVTSMLADAESGVLPSAPEPASEAFDAMLAERGVHVVQFSGWRAVDAAERALGASRGRDRTTIHDRADLFDAAEQDRG